MNALSTVATFFKQGGPFMYIILATGVAILAIALERLWVIGTAASLDGGKLAKDELITLLKFCAFSTEKSCIQGHSGTTWNFHAVTIFPRGHPYGPRDIVAFQTSPPPKPAPTRTDNAPTPPRHDYWH